MNSERLFQPFFDPIDLTVLCPAEANAQTLGDHVGDAAVWFPLFADPHASLARHLQLLEYAPCSARYGPFVDNILGVNWELPDGQIVRIGERVVKNSTGYDLLRFLLHAPACFGRATDYVLRLRARQTLFATHNICGSIEALNTARLKLLRSPWRHVINSIDWIFDAGGEGDGFLQLCIDTEEKNLSAYDSFYESLIEGQPLSMSIVEAPWWSPLRVGAAIKTLPGKAATLAAEIHLRYGNPVVCLTVSGYVIVYLSKNQDAFDSDLLSSWHQRVADQGGHVRATGYAPPNPPDQKWVDTLLKTFNKKQEGAE
jgi:hypothetical protein